MVPKIGIEDINYILAKMCEISFWVYFVGGYIVYKVVYFWNFDTLYHIPGPWWSVFTSLPYQTKRLSGDIDRYSRYLHTKYGTIVRIGPQMVSICKNQDIRLILSSHKYPKSRAYEKSVTNEYDIFSTTRPDFNKMRRMQLGRPLTQTSIIDAEELITKRGIEQLIKKLDQDINVGNGYCIINLLTLFQSLTADIIAELTFGETFEAVKNGGHPVLQWIEYTIKVAVMGMIFPLSNYFPVIFKKMKQGKQKMMEYVFSRVQKRRLLSKMKQKTHIKQDILQSCLLAVNRNGKKLTESQIIAEIMILILAGTDTTGITMTWLIHFYLLYPRVFERVVEEIKREFPDKTKRIGYKEALKKLPYSVATIKECMRIKPAASGVLPRDSSSDGVRLSGGYVPPDTVIMLVVEGGNYDKSVWENPDKFMPERFLGEKGKLLTKKLVTFSSGVRSCPGKNLVWMEILTVIPNLVRGYNIELLSDSVYRPDKIDQSRQNEPLLYKDYNYGTRVIADYENVCRVKISHRK
ncbi:hypothetical protein BB561_004321 [Smittium simulii]|uniref:Cytochrome P450 n=1 Tax=Smittium simulii TaxID=133385 RepID=A0A2T9YGZ3_9FUNG|nr:hypothetical protein BB561_004321 [Smittium simulii]